MLSLYEYYKKISNLYNLVFRYIPIQFFGVIIFNIIAALIGIFVIFKLFIGNFLAQFLVEVVFIALFWLSLWFLVRFSKSILNNKYKTYIKGINVGIGLDDIIQVKIVDKLIELNWYTSSKVEKLISRYEKHAENLKFKIPIIPSVFVILFIPLWSQFVGWKYKNITTYEEGMRTFYSFTAAILTVAVVLLMIKSFFENTFLGFLNRDYSSMKSLARILEDILLGIDEKPKIATESKSNESVAKVNQSNKKKKTV